MLRFTDIQYLMHDKVMVSHSQSVQSVAGWWHVHRHMLMSDDKEGLGSE